MSELQTRMCGFIHPEGVICSRVVYYEKGCCTDTVYNHEGPHQFVDKDGVITHRWEEVRVIKDVPFDAYKPLEEESE